MNSIFEILLPEYDLDLDGNTQVCCPFPHKTANGEDYYETRPSAGVNIDKDVFNCFVCGGKSGVSFTKDFLGISYNDAFKIKNLLENSPGLNMWDQPYDNLSPEQRKYITDTFHISESVIDELKIGYTGAGKFSYPVSIFNQLVDVVTYYPDQFPKVRRKPNSMSGMIIPYDIWKDSTKPTVICAGEKDMAIARSKGINAISITGGEKTVPKLFAKDFKDRAVYIAYDNDDAGREGASKLAVFLKPLVRKLKVIDLSETCTEKGEDLWDYFVKYNKTKKDLSLLIRSTKDFDEQDYIREKNKIYPLVSLFQATSPMYQGQIVQSNIQVVGKFEEVFTVPSNVTAKKFKLDEKAQMELNQTLHWSLEDDNAEDILYLMDSNLKESQIKKHLDDLLGVPPKEKYVSKTLGTKESIHKCTITDYIESSDDETIQMELLAYSFNSRLQSGNNYTITYKAVPHPLNAMKNIIVILDISQNQDSVTNFKVDENKIELLKQFQVTSTLKQTIDHHVERARALIGADYDSTLIKSIDFCYHSVLKFNAGGFTDLRGYLDSLVVTESRIGKSSTVDKLQEIYGLGAKTSLAGSNATIAGIVGGSDKSAGGGFQTKAGIIPRNNKGMVIFDELGKAKAQIMVELTDIRSSNMVNISRVNGTLRLPAWVRKLSLSNTKTTLSGSSRPITSYPHGIAIIADLIGAAEDIARYDAITILGTNASKPIDPHWKAKQEPFSEESYRTRIRWVWSRTPEQIDFPKEIYTHVIERSNELNKLYDSHIKIFGIEAWKKISRLAIAIAGYVVSTDETFEKIVVTKEHIDYAIDFLVSIYDNSVFRLREYVHEQRKYSEFSDEGKVLLQKLFKMNPVVLMHLENAGSTSNKTLTSMSSMEQKDFSKFFNQLVAGYFVQYHGHDIVPTVKFRKTMQHIDRNVEVSQLGADTYLKIKVDK